MTTLAQKTLAFWNMSLQYNGKSKAKLSTENAIKQLRDIVTTTTYERPLKRQADKMYIDVIHGPQQAPTRLSTIGMIKRVPS